MMLVLDTNVISEAMRPRPDAAVVAWLDAQPTESLWTTAITVLELQFGIEILPEGKRKRELQSSFDDSLKEDFRGRIFPFDTMAARNAGRLAGELRKQGRELEIRDLQIAGIVAAQHASLVTRNVKDFRDMGIPVINPWSQ